VLVLTVFDADATVLGALRAGAARLTDREREVAHSAADGLGNVEIGARLHLSTSSVKAAISGALATLDVDNRAQLAIRAHESRHDRPGP